MTDVAHAAQVGATIGVGALTLLAVVTVGAALAWCVYLAVVTLGVEVRHRVTARRLHRQAQQSGRQPRGFAAHDGPRPFVDHERPLDGSEPIHRGAPQ